MAREKLELSDDIVGVITKMSEDVHGAIIIMVEIVESRSDGFARLIDLDNMNMRGLQICVGYTYFADERMDVFLDAVEDHDQDMIDVVNKECAQYGELSRS